MMLHYGSMEIRLEIFLMLALVFHLWDERRYHTADVKAESNFHMWNIATN